MTDAKKDERDSAAECLKCCGHRRPPGEAACVFCCYCPTVSEAEVRDCESLQDVFRRKLRGI